MQTNMKGRKTDVQDCQWVQRLHSVGYLKGSFLPDLQTEELKTLYCHLDFRIKQGGTDTECLTSLAHYTVRKSKEEIAHTLSYNKVFSSKKQV